MAVLAALDFESIKNVLKEDGGDGAKKNGTLDQDSSHIEHGATVS
jgi:hypothetical protein